ncbi:MAG: conjugative transposon protein TraK [Chitinophagaceae bacterium]
MFRQFKNIDAAFKHVRVFSLALVLATVIICGYNSYQTSQVIRESQQKVYFIANGKLIDAVAMDKKEVVAVQLRKHVEMFHFYFYSLEPDEELIKKNVTKALYLADDKAKSEYDNLREQSYYSGIVSGNISQRIDMDSVIINTDRSPYSFTYYGKLKIIRPTTIATRSLITQGWLRPLQTISENNSYGYLIERWQILENKDLNTEKR